MEEKHLPRTTSTSSTIIHAAPETETKSPISSPPSIDTARERLLIRKLDLAVIPPVMLLYLFSFLDRVNIGNARLYGLERSLNLHGSQYQTAVSILFVTYLLSELPSNLVLKKLRPSRWISALATGWGVVATLTGIVQSYAGLLVCRLLLGALEGGLFPGLTVYLTLFYTKREIALRVGYLFVSSAIAGSVGGLLAYAIGHMDGVAGLAGWRWIFIIEGLPTFILGVSCWWWLANDPETAYFLTAEDREVLHARKIRQSGWVASADEFHREDVIKGLKDWKIWAFSFAQFGTDAMLYGYSTFLPTIIHGLGHWSSAQVQALTIPCYAVGAIVYLVVAWISDRTQKRGVFVVVFGIVSIVGYGILLANVSGGVHYFGCFMIAFGLYVTVGLPLGWLPSNNPRYGKRTTATGLQLTIGNSSGIMAPFLYKTNTGPRFILGHAVTLSLVAFSSILFSLMTLYFRARNKRRIDGKEDSRVRGMTAQQVAELGDESPQFLFTY